MILAPYILARDILARDAVLAEARTWLGTPYRHQAALRGAGCDCLGLVRGVYGALVGPLPEAVPAYAPGWAERLGDDPLLAAARRHLAPLPGSEWRPGDVLLFRLRPGAAAKHMAIAAGPDRMIHAHDGAAVCETAIGPWWRRRVAAVFAFPGVPL